jgi:hypothetical protein
VMRHTSNVVDALVGERPFRVLGLGLGLPMLNEIELHPRQGRARRPGRAEGIGRRPSRARTRVADRSLFPIILIYV